MITFIIIQSLATTTLILCMKKWGWLDWYIIHRPFWMPDAICYLCLGFWLSLIECLIIFSFGKGLLEYLFAPFCSAALINLLVNKSINV